MPFKLKVGDVIVPGQIINISETGCFVVLEGNIEGEAPLSIHVDHEQLNFESIVRLARMSAIPNGLGLVFVEPTRENRWKLKELIRSAKAQNKISPILAR